MEKTDDVCRDFLRNVCKRGKQCRYRHPSPTEARELGKQEYTFCQDFQKHGCNRGTCKFIHGTREEEEYYKSTGELPVRLQQAAALGTLIPAQNPSSGRGEVPVCMDNLKGECKRGARCKYRHVEKNEYEYEGRMGGDRPYARAAPYGSRYDPYDDDYSFDYDHGAGAKRRRPMPGRMAPLGDDFAEDSSMLRAENVMLRRKVEQLQKQVADLAATNEVLLDQNARLRTRSATRTQVPW